MLTQSTRLDKLQNTMSNVEQTLQRASSIGAPGAAAPGGVGPGSSTTAAATSGLMTVHQGLKPAPANGAVDMAAVVVNANGNGSSGGLVTGGLPFSGSAGSSAASQRVPHSSEGAMDATGGSAGASAGRLGATGGTATNSSTANPHRGRHSPGHAMGGRRGGGGGGGQVG